MTGSSAFAHLACRRAGFAVSSPVPKCWMPSASLVESSSSDAGRRIEKKDQCPVGTSVAHSKDMRQPVVLLILLLGVFVSNALAQSSERLYEGLSFRFVTPGARAVAIGKTFVGLADDATAAYSNPAGLSNLLEPEFSFELTTTRIRHHRFVPSETGETQVFGERVVAPSFLSYAHPTHNFTFLVFRNVVQNYEENFEFVGRYIPSIGRRENGAFGNIDVQSVNYGLGLSYLINRYLSVGGSAILSTIDVNTMSRTGTPEHPRNGTDTNDSGTAPSFIAGMLFKPTPRISVGAVYNSGSTFGLTTTLWGLFIVPGPNQDLTGVRKPVDFVIPDKFAIGVSGKINDHLTAALDVSRIYYSQQITDNFLMLEDNFERPLVKENFYINDVTEIHGGVEYRFYGRKWTWAARMGLFADPDHPLRFRSLPDTDPLGALVADFRFNSLKQQTNLGVTFGGGVAVSNRVQFDLAYSHSRDAVDVVASLVIKP